MGKSAPAVTTTITTTSSSSPFFLLYFLTFVDMDGNDVGSRTLTLLGTWIGCLLYLKQEKRWRYMTDGKCLLLEATFI
ncbi:hypothetical protein TRIATDRAFT_301787 [Trichoderma atroviride IMI 206040]|uniref:Uncharacterized protein n=1 Tax=Hypocrea atroviridis (strain ATCC 20476 / IMI 206040) TaxID=452589 RepID=G9P452_HYPAI|nr:uncharacterized protein TRIATDRAFT_301787 [Trichoderma atroviride IMI 206040]EHK41108.1 hypothetical protein TRIATDRAFT_301787 [Trichoderma atroviride IMI 206040]